MAQLAQQPLPRPPLLQASWCAAITAVHASCRSIFSTCGFLRALSYHSKELEHGCVRPDGSLESQDPNSAPVIANAASTAVAQGAPAKAVSKSLAQVPLSLTLKP